MSLAKQLQRQSTEIENWRYTDLNKIIKNASTMSPTKHGAVNLENLTISMEVRLTFINGSFASRYSNFGNLPQEILEGTALSGYKLTLAGQTCLVTQPIELYFLSTADGPEDIATTLSIELGTSGRLTLLEVHEKQSECSPRQSHSIETSITLKRQAKLVHGKICKNSGLHFANTVIEIDEGAFYDSLILVKGGHYVRNEIRANLSGMLAQCALRGVVLLNGSNHSDILTNLHHLNSHGTSRQYFKTIADGKSQGVFQGKIIVAKQAQKTDGQQLSRALLLSDQAEVDNKPILEINADDVKCSHGTTVGDIDDDVLFYIRSRGIDDKEARKILIGAFSNDLIVDIQIPNWRDMFRDEIEGWLNEQN